MSRRPRWVAVAALAAGVLAGCGGGPAPDVEEKPPPERIVAVTPSLTEILFSLGLGDKVVGVGDYSRWPPEVEAKTRIGGLFDARIEQIVALQPDLAVLLESEGDLATRLGELDIEVLTVRSETLDDVEASVAAIAERTGTEPAAEAFLARWRHELAAQTLPGEPTVLLTLAREPGRMGQILAAGPETFLDEMLIRLGAVNVLADAPVRYPQIGPEEVVQRRPAVIVELQPEVPTAAEAGVLIGDWAELPRAAQGPALCVKVIAGDHVLLPGPRLPRLYRELAGAIRECGGERRTAAAE